MILGRVLLAGFRPWDLGLGFPFNVLIGALILCVCVLL